MSKRWDVKLFLEDILDEIQRIKRFVEGIKSFEELQNNEMVLYAVLKAIENIGEAVKNIPDAVRNLYPLEWKKIAGLRDIVIHEYFGIDAEILWEVIKEKLPELELAVSYLIKIENS